MRMPRVTIAFIILTLILCATISLSPAQTTAIETPEQYFGFTPGTDRMLFDYEELIAYLQKVDAASPRLEMREIGASPEGRPMYVAFISSEKNIANLDKLKEINRRLALDPTIPETELQAMVDNGKVFFLATLSMHSDEVGPSQSAAIIAHDFVTTDDPQKLEWLDDVVFMMVPCHNPDGMDMIVHHYRKYKGTKYEGSSMPGVYHKYVGHDNNRDFVTLTQSDTKAIARVYNTEWYPQVFVEKHQMGSRGPRYFVPPNHDPIAENVNEGVWNRTWVLGSNLITDMTGAGLAGVSQHYLFDDYWPGSTETCIWKNVVGLLTEAASVKYATPIYVEPNELGAYGKGLSEYKKSINMPLPWTGGWWRLGDIVEYEIVSFESIIKTCSLYRHDFLANRNKICREEVVKGTTQAPFYYIMPREQHDAGELVALVNLLIEHGVPVFELAAPVTVSGTIYAAGDVVVPLAHAYRPFIKEVMEAQTYPVRHYTPNGEIIKPYDIATWSLPLHKGVAAVEMKERSTQLESSLTEIAAPYGLRGEAPAQYWAAVFTVNNNESFKAAFRALELELAVERVTRPATFAGVAVPRGSFVIHNGPKMKQLLDEATVAPLFVAGPVEFAGSRVTMPRIALVETYMHDMDAGWTRYIFDTYHIPFEVIRPGEFEKTDFAKRFDVVVFPDVDKDILMKAKREEEDYYVSTYPPEFTKGIGKDGMPRLAAFIDQGGIVVSWGRSARLFDGTLEIKKGKEVEEEFQLPFSDVSEKLEKAGLYCPGSLLRISLSQDHPVTLGMEGEIGVFSRGRPVFATTFPNFDMDRRVLATFPEKDILMSGYCEKEELLGNKTGLVWLKKNKGQLVLFRFNPQFRASTPVSYKLVFNALLLGEIE
jgi:hypothetical protein